ncbi:MAG: ABC transporter substrate-binding protein [Desulfococcaceae bacterium]
MQRTFRSTAIFLLMTAVLGALEANAGTLNYRLKWLFNTSVVGDLYADVHGFFKAEGLEVNVKPGGPERDAVRELELGHADFGVASADQVIRARAKGAPVVVLAQLFQINPLQWIYRASKPPVTELADLKGRTLGVTFGGNDETILRTLLAKAGLTERDLKLFSVRYDYTPFYRDQVDLWPVYRNAQGPILAKKLGAEGEDVAFFSPAEFGVQFVANSVVTSAETLEESPEMVEKFVRALMAGWRTALNPENNAKALETLAEFDKDTEPDILETQLDITRALVLPKPDAAMGAIDQAAWIQTERILVEQNQIDEPVGVEKALRPVAGVPLAR